MKKIADSFAEQLLAVKAIKLQPNDPFTWASGWKSPIYTDNRKTLAYPELRSFVKNELVHLVHTEFPEATAVAGVATSHRAHLLLTSCNCHTAMYVRSQRITVWETRLKEPFLKEQKLWLLKILSAQAALP